MSHKFPPHRLRSLQVAGTDDVNEDVWAVTNEINGRLGEHNFKTAAFDSRASLALGAGMRTYRATRTVAGNDRTASPANTFTIRKIPAWQAVDDLRIEFSGGPAMLWILTSFQGAFVPYSNLSGSASSVCQAAIRLDGNVLLNGVPGDLESQVFSGGSITGHGGAGTVALPYFDAAGLTQYWQPGVVEAMVPIGPGQHTIEVVARPVVMVGTVVARIYSRELIVLEMHL